MQGQESVRRVGAISVCLLLLVFALLAACGSAAGSQSVPVDDTGTDPAVALPSPASRANHHLPPVWQPLAARLAADGLDGPAVDALLATLPSEPSQDPMGRKMRELYRSKFLAQPAHKLPEVRYYKGVVTASNARLCQDFMTAHPAAFRQARRYGVVPQIAVALLFVETRLGRVLGADSKNALYTLASMAVSRTPESISGWLDKLPGYEEHTDWLQATMPKRADWAYRETRALIRHLLQEGGDPRHLPGSVYGAVGLCQFMPSNISVYGVDGDGDGKVDLFVVDDAVASLSNYLARHGWKPGLSRSRQQKILMRYNNSRVYADTILALADLIRRAEQRGSPPKAAKK